MTHIISYHMNQDVNVYQAVLLTSSVTDAAVKWKTPNKFFTPITIIFTPLLFHFHTYCSHFTPLLFHFHTYCSHFTPLLFCFHTYCSHFTPLLFHFHTYCSHFTPLLFHFHTYCSHFTLIVLFVTYCSQSYDNTLYYF